MLTHLLPRLLLGMARGRYVAATSRSSSHLQRLRRSSAAACPTRWSSSRAMVVLLGGAPAASSGQHPNCFLNLDYRGRGGGRRFISGSGLPRQYSVGSNVTGSGLPPSKLIRRLPPPRLGTLITMLSIDGGGMHGLIPAVVLDSLEKKFQAVDGADARLADYFDVVTGASTGALIAAMLVIPNEHNRPKFTPNDIKQFYLDNGPRIFPDVNKDWLGKLGRVGELIRAWWAPKYDGAFLHEKIQELTGKHTLADTLSTIVVPTFDIHRLEHVIFSSFKDHPKEIKPFLSDICIGTSAAPTYLPAHAFWRNGLLRSYYHLINGGVVANNPTMAAISRVTREQLLKNPDFHLGGGVDYNRYLVISIGTGSAVKGKGAYTAERSANWGALDWAHNKSNSHSPIIDVFSHSSALSVDWQVRTLLHNDQNRNKYLRIQTQGPLFWQAMSPMDDATEEKMAELVTIGDQLLEQKVASVDLTTWRYGTDKGEKTRTNNEEFNDYAERLSKERKLRLRAQEGEKNSMATANQAQSKEEEAGEWSEPEERIC